MATSLKRTADKMNQNGLAYNKKIFFVITPKHYKQNHVRKYDYFIFWLFQQIYALFIHD